MHIVEILGRILLSAIFLINGIGKIFNYEGTIQYMENFDVPGYLIIPAITVEIFISNIVNHRLLHKIFCTCIVIVHFGSCCDFPYGFFKSNAVNIFLKKHCYCRWFFNYFCLWSW